MLRLTSVIRNQQDAIHLSVGQQAVEVSAQLSACLLVLPICRNLFSPAHALAPHNDGLMWGGVALRVGVLHGSILVVLMHSLNSDTDTLVRCQR